MLVWVLELCLVVILVCFNYAVACFALVCLPGMFCFIVLDCAGLLVV